MYICKHFVITELVSPNAYNALGEQCWRLFSDHVKRSLDQMRETFGKSITINSKARNLTQRGLRVNTDQIVKDKSKAGSTYLSSHCFAYGFDFDVAGNSAETTYEYILNNQHLFPYIVRMESKYIGDTKKLRPYVHIEIGVREPGTKIVIFKA